MDMILLGFLMIRQFTLYEIKKVMERTVSFFYSASYGSLHPALKKMELKGYIHSKKNIEGRRIKITYSITQLGRKKHNAWLKSDIPQSKYHDEALLRLFFLHSLPVKFQLLVLGEYTKQLSMRRESLKSIIDKNSIENIPEEEKYGNQFRMLTAKYGMEQMALELKFYKNVMSNIEKD